MALCNLANIKPINIDIDYLNQEAMQTYSKRNIAGTIPMIEEGHYKVLGGANQMYLYLCKSKPDIEKRFFPSS